MSRFRSTERVARRKLLHLHAATELAGLRIPRGNRLEALKAARRGQHSIRINDPWRICFVGQSIADMRPLPMAFLTVKRNSSFRNPIRINRINGLLRIEWE